MATSRPKKVQEKKLPPLKVTSGGYYFPVSFNKVLEDMLAEAYKSVVDTGFYRALGQGDKEAFTAGKPLPENFIPYVDGERKDSRLTPEDGEYVVAILYSCIQTIHVTLNDLPRKIADLGTLDLISQVTSSFTTFNDFFGKRYPNCRYRGRHGDDKYISPKCDEKSEELLNKLLTFFDKITSDDAIPDDSNVTLVTVEEGKKPVIPEMPEDAKKVILVKQGNRFFVLVRSDLILLGENSILSKSDYNKLPFPSIGEGRRPLISHKKFLSEDMILKIANILRDKGADVPSGFLQLRENIIYLALGSKRNDITVGLLYKAPSSLLRSNLKEMYRRIKSSLQFEPLEYEIIKNIKSYEQQCAGILSMLAMMTQKDTLDSQSRRGTFQSNFSTLTTSLASYLDQEKLPANVNAAKIYALATRANATIQETREQVIKKYEEHGLKFDELGKPTVGEAKSELVEVTPGVSVEMGDEIATPTDNSEEQAVAESPVEEVQHTEETVNIATEPTLLTQPEVQAPQAQSPQISATVVLASPSTVLPLPIVSTSISAPAVATPTTETPTPTPTPVVEAQKYRSRRLETQLRLKQPKSTVGPDLIAQLTESFDALQTELSELDPHTRFAANVTTRQQGEYFKEQLKSFETRIAALELQITKHFSDHQLLDRAATLRLRVSSLTSRISRFEKHHEYALSEEKPSEIVASPSKTTKNSALQGQGPSPQGPSLVTNFNHDYFPSAESIKKEKEQNEQVEKEQKEQAEKEKVEKEKAEKEKAEKEKAEKEKAVKEKALQERISKISLKLAELEQEIKESAPVFAALTSDEDFRKAGEVIGSLNAKSIELTIAEQDEIRSHAEYNGLNTRIEACKTKIARLAETTKVKQGVYEANLLKKNTIRKLEEKIVECNQEIERYQRNEEQAIQSTLKKLYVIFDRVPTPAEIGQYASASVENIRILKDIAGDLKQLGDDLGRAITIADRKKIIADRESLRYDISHSSPILDSKDIALLETKLDSTESLYSIETNAKIKTLQTRVIARISQAQSKVSDLQSSMPTQANQSEAQTPGCALSFDREEEEEEKTHADASGAEENTVIQKIIQMIKTDEKSFDFSIGGGKSIGDKRTVSAGAYTLFKKIETLGGGTTSKKFNPTERKAIFETVDTVLRQKQNVTHSWWCSWWGRRNSTAKTHQAIVTLRDSINKKRTI